MLIGERIRTLRERRGMSQGDVEEKTGLLRCYTSRVENGHTVPSLETIEKIARALDLPLYQIFYDGDKPPDIAPLSTDGRRKPPFGKNAGEGKYIQTLLRYIEGMDPAERKSLLRAARDMSKASAHSAGDSQPQRPKEEMKEEMPEEDGQAPEKPA